MGFNSAGHGALEENIRGSGKFTSLHCSRFCEKTVRARNDAASRHERHLGIGCQEQSGFDHAVITQRNAQAGVCAQQTAFAQADLVVAATAQSASGRSSAAYVGSITDDNAARDTAFDQAAAQRARIEVHERGMHDCCALRQVGTQANFRTVSDPDSIWHDVVHHRGELIHAGYGDRTVEVLAQAKAGFFEVIDRTRACRRPHN